MRSGPGTASYLHAAHRMSLIGKESYQVSTDQSLPRGYNTEFTADFSGKRNTMIAKSEIPLIPGTDTC